MSRLRGNPGPPHRCSFPLPSQDPESWEATPAAALPEPMAIKGPEMEELGGGPGCSLNLRDRPVCPRGTGLPGWEWGLAGGQQPWQLGAESGGWGISWSPPPAPASQGAGTFRPCPEMLGICVASHGGLGVGIKLPFHPSPELWGGGGWRGLRGTQRAPPLAPRRLSPDNGRPLLGFYTPGPLPRGPAGDILPPPHSHGDSKGTDAP